MHGNAPSDCRQRGASRWESDGRFDEPVQQFEWMLTPVGPRGDDTQLCALKDFPTSSLSSSGSSSSVQQEWKCKTVSEIQHSHPCSPLTWSGYTVVVVVVLVSSIYTSRMLRLLIECDGSSNRVQALCVLPAHVRHQQVWSRNTGSSGVSDNLKFTTGVRILLSGWTTPRSTKCFHAFQFAYEDSMTVGCETMFGCHTSIRPSVSHVGRTFRRPLSTANVCLCWLLTASHFKGLILYDTSG